MSCGAAQGVGNNDPVPSDADHSQSIPAAAAEAVRSALAALETASNADEVKALDVLHLGKASQLTGLKAGLRAVDPQDRPAAGQALNAARREVEDAIAAKLSALEAAEQDARLASEAMDLSEVVVDVAVGHLHPVTSTWRLLEDVFVGMGYAVAEGPEIEDDWMNFGALNLPPDHPARSMWDTLYVDPGPHSGAAPDTMLLRTHTSPVQVRTMSTQEPPVYIVAPGRTFRRDTADATHLPVFHQIEGLAIDRRISFADLAGTIDTFVKALFGPDRRTRLRPSYFPFTEPSAEFDMTTAEGDWLELGGCGMVHPNVLRNCGLDPEEWSGFAFGFGIDRIAQMLHGISDMRELVANDLRFLGQF